jgi:hypothetical protein
VRSRPGLSPHFRRFERYLGIDRRGRTTWVWIFPLAVGLAAGGISPFMPGLPEVFGMFGAIFFGVFAFVTMTIISVLYMIAFDRDRNQVGDQDTTWSGRPVRR